MYDVIFIGGPADGRHEQTDRLNPTRVCLELPKSVITDPTVLLCEQFIKSHYYDLKRIIFDNSEYHFYVHETFRDLNIFTHILAGFVNYRALQPATSKEE